MSHTIHNQRCFKIPRNSLDLFLVKVNMTEGNGTYYEAAYIFENEDQYDVVINELGLGSYLFLFSEIEKFVKELQEK